MLFLQILAAVVFFGLIVLAILAFIEPGPLERRSRDRRGRSPVPPSGDQKQASETEPATTSGGEAPVEGR